MNLKAYNEGRKDAYINMKHWVQGFRENIPPEKIIAFLEGWITFAEKKIAEWE